MKFSCLVCILLHALALNFMRNYMLLRINDIIPIIISLVTSFYLKYIYHFSHRDITPPYPLEIFRS